MTFGWVAAGTAVLGAVATTSAANKQAGAAKYAADLQNQTQQENVARQQPFYDVGVNALPNLVAAAEYKPFDINSVQQDPGYGFRFSEGLKALDRLAASRGKTTSGETERAAVRFGQDYASQEYQNAYARAFGRYQTESAIPFSRYQTLANIGQGTASTLGSTGAAAAGNIGNALMSGANAQAAGMVGAANQFTGAANQYMNYTGNQNLVNAIRQSGYTQATTPSGISPTYSGGTGPTA
jgi:hypothetical protein